MGEHQGGHFVVPDSVHMDDYGWVSESHSGPQKSKKTQSMKLSKFLKPMGGGQQQYRYKIFVGSCCPSPSYC